ncbi:MAG: DUF5985 family protein [Rhizomicrobium sp.]
MNPINTLLSAYAHGLFTAAALVAALFFLRFWRRSGDGLFLGFSLGFLLMAANSVADFVLGSLNDQKPAVYLFRLAGFMVILFAIWRKNRRRRPGRMPR